MDVSSVSGLTSASALSTGTTSTTGTTSLGEDAFLRLLTTQMQYQDPLEPMSNEEFVSQLAQFSSLEQLQGIGSDIESSYLVDVSMNNAAMVNLLGQTVVAKSDTFHYAGSGDQSVHFDCDGTADTAELTITDSDGTVVYSGSIGALADGEGSWTWNGKNTDGTVTEPEGDYTFSITAATDAGDSVDVTGLIVGTVSTMDYSSGSPAPEVDGVPIEIGDILRVETGGAS